MPVVLFEAAPNLTALASALDVAPSTPMRMVDRLETAGLVERSVYPENRRDVSAVLSQLSDEEQAALAAAMTAFARAANTLWPGEADTIS